MDDHQQLTCKFQVSDLYGKTIENDHLPVLAPGSGDWSFQLEHIQCFDPSPIVLSNQAKRFDPGG